MLPWKEHLPLSPTRTAPRAAVAQRNLETAARVLAAVAMFMHWHAYQLREQSLREPADLRVARHHVGQRTAVAADDKVVARALFELREA